jgi:hypothetical protein
MSKKSLTEGERTIILEAVVNGIEDGHKSGVVVEWK